MALVPESSQHFSRSPVGRIAMVFDLAILGRPSHLGCEELKPRPAASNREPPRRGRTGVFRLRSSQQICSLARRHVRGTGLLVGPPSRRTSHRRLAFVGRIGNVAHHCSMKVTKRPHTTDRPRRRLRSSPNPSYGDCIRTIRGRSGAYQTVALWHTDPLPPTRHSRNQVPVDGKKSSRRWRGSGRAGVVHGRSAWLSPWLWGVEERGYGADTSDSDVLPYRRQEIALPPGQYRPTTAVCAGVPVSAPSPTTSLKSLCLLPRFPGRFAP